MRLQAEIIVRRAPDDVAAFLGDVRNIPSWDRGVAAIRTTPDAKPGVGFAFEPWGIPARLPAPKTAAWDTRSVRWAPTDPLCA
jgi:hypothetical protein